MSRVTEEELRGRYLDLLKRILTNSIYEDRSVMPSDRYVTERRELGEDWPLKAHTMIGLRRLENLQACLECVLSEGVQGDIVETGVWRGGASIFVRGVLVAYGVHDRVVWAVDSFEGLPTPDVVRYPADADDQHARFNNYLAVPLEVVHRNFAKYGLLDSQVQFIKGWFRDTLPSAPISTIAVLRVDGDMYESTWQALSFLYPKVSSAGFVIIDDYYTNGGCRRAVEDYRRTQSIHEPIRRIDRSGAYWRLGEVARDQNNVG